MHDLFSFGCFDYVSSFSLTVTLRCFDNWDLFWLAYSFFDRCFEYLLLNFLYYWSYYCFRNTLLHRDFWEGWLLDRSSFYNFLLYLSFRLR